MKPPYDLRPGFLGVTWVCSACAATGYTLTLNGAEAEADRHVARVHRGDPERYYPIITERLLFPGYVVECSADDWSTIAREQGEARTLWNAHATAAKHQ